MPVVRDTSELEDQNPVYAAFSGNVVARPKRDDVRNAALGAYMGLIKQIDDQMGGLFICATADSWKTLSSPLRPTMATIWAITGSARKTCSTNRRWCR